MPRNYLPLQPEAPRWDTLLHQGPFSLASIGWASLLLDLLWFRPLEQLHSPGYRCQKASVNSPAWLILKHASPASRAWHFVGANEASPPPTSCLEPNDGWHRASGRGGGNAHGVVGALVQIEAHFWGAAVGGQVDCLHINWFHRVHWVSFYVYLCEGKRQQNSPRLQRKLRETSWY